MAIRPLNSSLIFDRRVILGLAAAVVLVFTFAFLYSPDLRPSSEWIPPLTSKPTSPFSPPLKNAEDPYIVELDYLAIRPNVTDKVRSYWNIPYAADAGGKNRFRGPQPVNRTYGIGIGEKPLVWDGALGMCPRIQKIDPNLRNRKDISGPEVLGIKARSTEDCLSLNVFTPFDAEPGDDLPVLVNIPGGGFHLPGRSNGGEMVEKARREKGVNGKLDKGIVVVTMYYRNGIYGFLSGEQIAKDGDYNNGLRDQRAALEWVQKYIRYFGGNPDHVVIMGTSAGGASVMLQLTANEGDNYYPVPGTGRKQLFHGAIAQSPASPTFFTTEQAEKFYNEVASGLNCTDIACVRNAATGDLYYENYPMSFPGRNTPPRWMWAPTAEPKGGMFTAPAPASIMANRYAKVPSIIGFTTNEGSDQVKKTLDSEADFKSYIKDHYPLLTDADLATLASTYPNDRHWPDSGRYWDAAAKAQGDIRYICPTYLASNAMAKHNPDSVPTYQYQWDVMWGVDIENGFGTKHAGTVGQVMVRRQNEISDYFISFIKFLDPNREHETIPREKAAKLAKWLPLDSSGRRMFFTNIKEGGHRGDGVDMLGPVRTQMRGRDEGREGRCAVVKGLFGRLQFEGVEAVKVG
ncbi:cholinesterase precursor [Pyrenophora seminiperda CCB06]|uniref:Carboxylic ester hydrolase n=1 Tax=Pyrenophora seminiperda CCB06 TaxID=1302712 RepID=A0A3M7LZM5_9PLEO|nr:cholinesterase precursor [Pyrenophora seminiperda CCB06]